MYSKTKFQNYYLDNEKNSIVFNFGHRCISDVAACVSCGDYLFPNAYILSCFHFVCESECLAGVLDTRSSNLICPKCHVKTPNADTSATRGCAYIIRDSLCRFIKEFDIHPDKIPCEMVDCPIPHRSADARTLVMCTHEDCRGRKRFFWEPCGQQHTADTAWLGDAHQTVVYTHKQEWDAFWKFVNEHCLERLQKKIKQGVKKISGNVSHSVSDTENVGQGEAETSFGGSSGSGTPSNTSDFRQRTTDVSREEDDKIINLSTVPLVTKTEGSKEGCSTLTQSLTTVVSLEQNYPSAAAAAATTAKQGEGSSSASNPTSKESKKSQPTSLPVGESGESLRTFSPVPTASGLRRGSIRRLQNMRKPSITFDEVTTSVEFDGTDSSFGAITSGSISDDHVKFKMLAVLQKMLPTAKEYCGKYWKHKHVLEANLREANQVWWLLTLNPAWLCNPSRSQNRRIIRKNYLELANCLKKEKKALKNWSNISAFLEILWKILHFTDRRDANVLLTDPMQAMVSVQNCNRFKAFYARTLCEVERDGNIWQNPVINTTDAHRILLDDSSGKSFRFFIPGVGNNLFHNKEISENSPLDPDSGIKIDEAFLMLLLTTFEQKEELMKRFYLSLYLEMKRSDAVTEEDFLNYHDIPTEDVDGCVEIAKHVFALATDDGIKLKMVDNPDSETVILKSGECFGRGISWDEKTYTLYALVVGSKDIRLWCNKDGLLYQSSSQRIPDAPRNFTKEDTLLAVLGKLYICFHTDLHHLATPRHPEEFLFCYDLQKGIWESITWDNTTSLQPNFMKPFIASVSVGYLYEDKAMIGEFGDYDIIDEEDIPYRVNGDMYIILCDAEPDEISCVQVVTFPDNTPPKTVQGVALPAVPDKKVTCTKIALYVERFQEIPIRDIRIGRDNYLHAQFLYSQATEQHQSQDCELRDVQPQTKKLCVSLPFCMTIPEYQNTVQTPDDRPVEDVML